MIGLEVQFEMLEQIVLAQEIQAGCRVGIILVLRRLLRFGFNVERAFETDLLVIHRHVRKSAQMNPFAFEVGVQQRRVTLADPRTRSRRRRG